MKIVIIQAAQVRNAKDFPILEILITEFALISDFYNANFVTLGTVMFCKPSI
jgi:hypothetical protein